MNTFYFTKKKNKVYNHLYRPIRCYFPDISHHVLCYTYIFQMFKSNKC